MKTASSLLAAAAMLALSACSGTAGNNMATANATAPVANAAAPAPADANLTGGNMAAGNSTKPAGDGNAMPEDEGMMEEEGNMVDGQ